MLRSGLQGPPSERPGKEEGRTAPWPAPARARTGGSRPESGDVRVRGQAEGVPRDPRRVQRIQPGPARRDGGLEGAKDLREGEGEGAARGRRGRRALRARGVSPGDPQGGPGSRPRGPRCRPAGWAGLGRPGPRTCRVGP